MRLESSRVLEREVGRWTGETEEVVAEEDLLASLLETLRRRAQAEAGVRVPQDGLWLAGRTGVG